jgi:hypothetical protein
VFVKLEGESSPRGVSAVEAAESGIGDIVFVFGDVRLLKGFRIFLNSDVSESLLLEIHYTSS